MERTQIIFLVGVIWLLIALVAFFSSTETGIMSINRYRLKHLAKTSHSAKRVQALLNRPDRLFGVILIGNTLVLICASSIATVLGVELGGEKMGIFLADTLLTFFLLVFGEVAPKTLAALFPEKIAFSTVWLLERLLKLFYPLVWLINGISNGLLKLGGISRIQVTQLGVTREELRTVVHEAAGRIPSKHYKMLLSILDLEKVTVDDIMVSRHEVIGLDLENEWEAILGQLANTQHTFLPVYRHDINNLIGILHAKKALLLMSEKELTQEKLRHYLDEAFFIPTGTSLTKQLINFQKNKQRFALVVDEYGDILGLLTLEDILEEIVGEFTTDMAASYLSVLKQTNGSYLVEGSTTLREFNRVTQWILPTQGPKTLNGLVIEHLQTIPEVGTCCLINAIPLEVVSVQDNRIKTLRVLPPLTENSDK